MYLFARKCYNIFIVTPGFYYRQVTDTAVGDPDQSVLLCEFVTYYPDMTVNITQVTYIGGSSCTDPSSTIIWQHNVVGNVIGESAVSTLCLQ